MSYTRNIGHQSRVGDTLVIRRVVVEKVDGDPVYDREKPEEYVFRLGNLQKLVAYRDLCRSSFL